MQKFSMPSVHLVPHEQVVNAMEMARQIGERLARKEARQAAKKAAASRPLEARLKAHVAAVRQRFQEHRIA